MCCTGERQVMEKICFICDEVILCNEGLYVRINGDIYLHKECNLTYNHEKTFSIEYFHPEDK